MFKSKNAVLVGTCLATAISAAVANAAVAPHTSQLIVQFGDSRISQQSVSRNQAVPGLTLPDGRPLKFLRTFNDNAMVVQLPEDVSLEEAQRIAARLAEQPGVAAAEPDRRFYPALVPNDPEYPASVLDPVGDPGQWHLFENTAGIRMPAAWDRETGSPGVTVAIIDSGIISHRDLDNGRVLAGYDFFSDSARDNDGTPGRDGDPTDPGDATVDGECGAGEIGEASSWHGLAVTGVIAATANNSIDIAGIDFDARLLPIRVLGKCGGSLSDLADAVRWAAGLAIAGVPNNPTPADVINLSLSGAGLCTAAEQSAIDAAVAAGSVIVVAAGNDAVNVANVSPANCNNVVAVGAIARDGRIAAYTNVGLAVDLTAPGGDDPDPPDPLNPPNGVRTLSNTGVTTPDADSLVVIQGTSFTTAQVSAVSALIRAVDGSLSPGLISTILKSTARTFPDPSCDSSVCGTGILDANAALAAAQDTAILVANLAPTAHAGGPYSGAEGVAISFDGSGSSDPESGPLSYSWDFGDDRFATGVKPAHVYATAGTYTVTLVVNDGIEDAAPATATVSVGTSSDARVDIDAGGGGGGCTLTARSGTVDPLWLLMVLTAGLYPVLRYLRRLSSRSC